MIKLYVLLLPEPQHLSGKAQKPNTLQIYKKERHGVLRGLGKAELGMPGIGVSEEQGGRVGSEVSTWGRVRHRQVLLQHRTRVSK